MPRRRPHRLELVRETTHELHEVDRLLRDAKLPRVDAREIEQIGRELRSRATCSCIVSRNRRRVASSRSSSVKQLQKAAEGEERSAQLVRRVRYELLARGVELGEPDPHPVEGDGELADLVVAAVDDRDVEVAPRDPLRRVLQPAEPVRQERRSGQAEREREQQREPGGEEQAALDRCTVASESASGA